jgi:FKBP-type peptidyl-prolyl cis-trans isomerase SlyD
MSQRVISFHYKLTNNTGETLDSSEGKQPLIFMEGAGQIIPALEHALKSLKVGDKKKVEIKAEQAYGQHDPKRVIEIPLDQMPKQKINVGDQFRSSREQNSPPVTVTKVSDSHVTLDTNHPLAGMDLTFDVEITEVRDATPDEVAHGHAHGPGGHHHH